MVNVWNGTASVGVGQPGDEKKPMPGLVQHVRARIALLTLAAALASCATTPEPPPMSPLQIAKYYGYTEAQLGEERYQVSYVGPNRRSLRSPGPVQENAAAERSMAFDFALWRAAQLARARGFPGLRVSNIRSDLTNYVDDYYDPLYSPGFYPYQAYPFGPRWGGPYWGPSPYVYQQATVTIDARLLRAPEPGDYLAADVIEQLQRTYPGAEGPPAGTPAAPS